MYKQNEKNLGELLGIILGDGCLSRSGNKYLLYICGHKIDDLWYYKNVVTKLIKNVMNKKVKINFKRGENTLFIRFSDKKIFYYLNKLGIPIGYKYEKIRIPKFVIDKGVFGNFVSGLFATDGCVVLSKQHKTYAYYPRVEITSKSKIFLLRIHDKLKEIGLSGSVSYKGSNAYRLEIAGFKNLRRWHRKIGFSNIKHYNKAKKAMTKTI